MTRRGIGRDRLSIERIFLGRWLDQTLHLILYLLGAFLQAFLAAHLFRVVY